MDLGLKGKKAIVVGGVRGIGRATAELLLREGCEVAISARAEDAVRTAVAEMSALGSVFGGAADARHADDYKTWIDGAVRRLDGLDILITMQSASGGMDGEKKWYDNFEVDVMGSVRAAEKAIPHLSRSGGAIVFVASTAAVETFVVPQPFNAMKAALITYGKQLSQQVAKDGVRVNVVSPGPVEFKGGNWETIKGAMEDLYNATVRQQPTGRLGLPEEVARACVFLASPAASWIDGVNLVVDGGFTKRVAF